MEHHNSINIFAERLKLGNSKYDIDMLHRREEAKDLSQNLLILHLKGVTILLPLKL